MGSLGQVKKLNEDVEKDVENIRPNISVKRRELRVKEKNVPDVEDDKNNLNFLLRFILLKTIGLNVHIINQIMRVI